MQVKHCMTYDPYTVGPTADVKDTFNLLKTHHIHQVPVVEDGMVIGIVTDRDLRLGIYRDDITVRDIMTPHPVTIFEDVKIEVAAQIILNRHFNAIPVVNAEGRLTGIITTHDILESLINMVGVKEEPVKVEVVIPRDIEFEHVLQIFQMSSDKMLSFVKSQDKEDTYIFWLRGCDFEHVEKKLKDREMKGVTLKLHE